MRRPRGTGRVRSEPRPGWRTVTPQKSPSLPLAAAVSSPAPISTVTCLAGTKCSQGSQDTGRSRTGSPASASRRVLGDLKPPPRTGCARASLSVQKAQEFRPPLSHCRRRPRPSQPQRWGDGLRCASRAEPSSSAERPGVRSTPGGDLTHPCFGRGDKVEGPDHCPPVRARVTVDALPTHRPSACDFLDTSALFRPWSE